MNSVLMIMYRYTYIYISNIYTHLYIYMHGWYMFILQINQYFLWTVPVSWPTPSYIAQTLQYQWMGMPSRPWHLAQVICGDALENMQGFKQTLVTKLGLSFNSYGHVYILHIYMIIVPCVYLEPKVNVNLFFPGGWPAPFYGSILAKYGSFFV